MDKPFKYGMSVDNEHFTDRKEETKRLKRNFESGVNVILISPRRMGKTSLVKRVKSEINNDKIKVVLMDIYDCRSEYEFYNRFAETILKQTAQRVDLIMENIKKFLVRLTPKVSFGTDPYAEFSVSLGITPKNYSPEEILSLPEEIAKEQGIQIVVCIDEFQQIGELQDSLTIQKRLRGIWQHQKNVSYCLFGSKKHLMTNLFQNKRMPFYQFGEMMELMPIATADWVTYIQSRFVEVGMTISESFAERICNTVRNHSSYVQQLAWNVMVETDKEVDEESFQNGYRALLAQSSSFFQEQIRTLSSYQLNFIRALCSGIHKNFGSKAVMEQFGFGSKSNIARVKTSLIEKELIEENGKGELVLSDYIFQQWFENEYM